METPGRFGASVVRHAMAACAAVAIVPAVAVAQSSTSGLASFTPLAPIGLPLAPIGLPLAPIGLPLPQLGLPPPMDPAPVRTSRRQNGERRHVEPGHGAPKKPHGRGRGTSVVYVVPSYGWGTWTHAGVALSTVPGTIVNEVREAARTGVLQLAIEPAVAMQVFVDGYFIGTSDEVGHALELEEGLHRIELRANGYKAHALDARITAHRTSTYQATLEPVDDPAAARNSDPARDVPTAPAASEPPATPTTIYFIPGCYLGNVPPEEARLPAGCDLSRLQTHKP